MYLYNIKNYITIIIGFIQNTKNVLILLKLQALIILFLKSFF